MMNKIIFRTVLASAAFSLTTPGYPLPIDSDPLPVNKFSSPYKVDKVSGVEYKYAVVEPSDGYYFQGQPFPGFSDCIVFNNDYTNPTLIPLGGTRYLVNQQIDSPAKKTTRTGVLDLSTGKQEILSSGSETDDTKNFYPFNILSFNSGNSFTVKGVLPLDKKLVFNGRCSYLPAQIKVENDSFKLSTLPSLPSKNIQNPSSMIIAEGSQYLLSLAMGYDPKYSNYGVYYHIVQKKGSDSSDWKIVHTARYDTDPLYMSDPERKGVIIELPQSEQIDSENSASNNITKKSIEVMPELSEGVGSIRANALYCDLDSDEDCKQIPPYRQKSSSTVGNPPYIEGFNRSQKQYLVSYQNPQSRDAGDRCLFLVGFDEEVIDIPDDCKIKLPPIDLTSSRIAWAGISDDQKYLYIVQDSLQEMMFISFSQNGKWEEFRTLHDAALELLAQRIAPQNPMYYIDDIRQNHPGELTVSGSVTSAGDTTSHRKAFVVDFLMTNTPSRQNILKSYPRVFSKMMNRKIF